MQRVLQTGSRVFYGRDTRLEGFFFARFNERFDNAFKCEDGDKRCGPSEDYGLGTGGLGDWGLWTVAPGLRPQDIYIHI